MPETVSKTIAAIATPNGTGAISLIRISGSEAFEIAAKATGGKIFSKKIRTATRCRILDSDGHAIDDGVVIAYQGPASFTGEDTIEFTGHGGMLVTREVLNRLLECGATHAEPGEFSQRAFINGKLDLTQAEGIMDLISAQSRLAIRAANSQLEGNLGKQTTAARDDVLAILAHLEAYIDFPEEDIAPETTHALLNQIHAIVSTLDTLLATADQGRILREGVHTVIFGEPNVGKSSLLNHLLGFERAIVSDIQGTTRDTLEEVVNIGGIALRLVDTAGIRESSDTIEQQGIQRTQKQVSSADLLLEVMDGSKADSRTKAEADSHSIRLLILNKSDLPEHTDWKGIEACRVSCETGDGFKKLISIIQDRLGMAEADFGEHAVAINARHQASLARARESLLTAAATLEEAIEEPELSAIDLREALDALGEIPGKVDTEDLLGVIFSEFCIGK